MVDNGDAEIFFQTQIINQGISIHSVGMLKVDLNSAGFLGMNGTYGMIGTYETIGTSGTYGMSGTSGINSITVMENMI